MILGVRPTKVFAFIAFHQFGVFVAPVFTFAQHKIEAVKQIPLRHEISEQFAKIGIELLSGVFLPQLICFGAAFALEIKQRIEVFKLLLCERSKRSLDCVFESRRACLTEIVIIFASERH